MATVLDTRPEDIADKADALRAVGRFSAAAHEYARAADLYAFERRKGIASAMTEQSLTCRRASRIRRHAVIPSA